MTIKITPNDKNNPPGKLADAELNFSGWPTRRPEVNRVWDLGTSHRGRAERDVPRTAVLHQQGAPILCAPATD